MNRGLIALFSCVSLIFTCMGLTNLMVAGLWQGHMIALPILFTVVVWLGTIPRFTERFPRISVLVSAVLGIFVWAWYLCFVVRGTPLTFPTPSTLTDVAWAVRDSILALSQYMRPVSNPEVFMPLAVFGLGPVCLLVVFLSLGAARPVWAGLPILGCWILFIAGNPSQGLGLAIATGVTFLFLVAVAQRMQTTPRGLRVMSVPVVSVGVICGLVATVVAPSLPGWGEMPDLFERLRGQYSDSTGVQLNSPIDVSNQLRSESDEVILFVRGKINGPLRAISLTSFSGTVWTPDPGARSVYHDDQMVWEGDEGRMISDKDPWSPNGEVYMEIRNPMGRYLPTTVGPRGITGTSGFGIAYELGTDSLQATRDIQRGDTYTIQSTVLDRSGLTVIDVDRGIGPNALPLVNTPYQEEIRNFTVEIIGSASTQGEMLAAIESYLRGPEFVYTLSPSWTTTGDPVWDFLQNKQGYCIHFSTAMAVMAMSVGIPMRVSIGFLVSPSDVDAWVEVRNTNAHMWPEALYPELGWVRYEPTPSITGAGPGDPTTSPPEPSDGPTTPDGVSTIVPSDLPSNQPSTPNNENPGISSGGLGWILGLAVGVLIAAGVGFGVRTAYVRSYTPERSWRVIRRKAIKVGLISEGTSVRSALKKVATRCDPDLAQTLDEVREYLETTWYSPNSETPAPISSTTTARLTRAVVRHLRHT